MLEVAAVLAAAADSSDFSDCNSIVANWENIVSTLEPASAPGILGRIVDTVRGTRASAAKQKAVDAVVRYVYTSLRGERYAPVARNELLRDVGRMLYFTEETCVQPSYGEQEAIRLFSEFLDDTDTLVRAECAHWLGIISFSNPARAEEILRLLEPRYAPLAAAETAGKGLSKEGDELQRAIDFTKRVIPTNDVMEQRVFRISDESYLAILSMSKEQLRELASTDKGRELERDPFRYGALHEIATTRLKSMTDSP